MEIVLQNNLILIRTDFDTLNQGWMKDFLIKHARNMLFLPKAVLVFKNNPLLEERKAFLSELGKNYATKHELPEFFFTKSLVRLVDKPVKVELISMQEVQEVGVEVYARDRYTVDISLYCPNAWIISFLVGQMGIYVKRYDELSIELDVSDSRSRTTLERVLSKRSILHYEIQYSYDDNFLRNLYNGFSIFDSDEHNDANIDRMMYFYNILQCPVGAPLDMIKKNYRKLARVYHPDRIFQKSPQMLDRYTQKFQLLQEAYTALKTVS